MDFEKDLANAIRDGIRKGVEERLTRSYSNPLDDIIIQTVKKYDSEYRAILDASLKSCLIDASFRDQVATAVRHSLAKTLVARFGGELEKQVNVLKSDPSTRARITLAIEEIVKERSAKL